MNDLILPPQYTWLKQEPGPRILREALALYGTKEITGDKHNPVILAWAKEIGGWIGSFYKTDEIPWCGLFVGVCAKRAKFPYKQTLLSALAWANWGQASNKPSLGDVLVFKRKGGGHVGFYVGEDDTAYHVLGGNQANQVSITRIAKERLFAARRCEWRVKQPANVRTVKLQAAGNLSTNEA